MSPEARAALEAAVLELHPSGWLLSTTDVKIWQAACAYQRKRDAQICREQRLPSNSELAVKKCVNAIEAEGS